MDLPDQNSIDCYTREPQEFLYGLSEGGRVLRFPNPESQLFTETNSTAKVPIKDLEGEKSNHLEKADHPTSSSSSSFRNRRRKKEVPITELQTHSKTNSKRNVPIYDLRGKKLIHLEKVVHPTSSSSSSSSLGDTVAKRKLKIPELKPVSTTNSKTKPPIKDLRDGTSIQVKKAVPPTTSSSSSSFSSRRRKIEVPIPDLQTHPKRNVPINNLRGKKSIHLEKVVHPTSSSSSSSCFNNGPGKMELPIPELKPYSKTSSKRNVPINDFRGKKSIDLGKAVHPSSSSLQLQIPELRTFSKTNSKTKPLIKDLRGGTSIQVKKGVRPTTSSSSSSFSSTPGKIDVPIPELQPYSKTTLPIKIKREDEEKIEKKRKRRESKAHERKDTKEKEGTSMVKSSKGPSPKADKESTETSKSHSFINQKEAVYSKPSCSSDKVYKAKESNMRYQKDNSSASTERLKYQSSREDRSQEPSSLRGVLKIGAKDQGSPSSVQSSLHTRDKESGRERTSLPSTRRKDISGSEGTSGAMGGVRRPSTSASRTLGALGRGSLPPSNRQRLQPPSASTQDGDLVRGILATLSNPYKALSPHVYDPS